MQRPVKSNSRVEKAGVVHAGIGKASFDAEKIAQNAQAFLDAIQKARNRSKGYVHEKSYHEFNYGTWYFYRCFSNNRITSSCLSEKEFWHTFVLECRRNSFVPNLSKTAGVDTQQ